MWLELKRWLTPLLCVMLVAGCASTSLQDEWADAGNPAGPFKRIVVLGVFHSAADRRVFEDIFVARLKAAGVDALPAYRYLPQEVKVDEPALADAVRRSGADALLMVRLLGVDTRTRVSPRFGPPLYPGYLGYGYFGYYSAWFDYPEVYSYEVATAETTLFDVAQNRLVWAGTTETFNPSTVRRESPGFADVIIRALARRGLIAVG